MRYINPKNHHFCVEFSAITRNLIYLSRLGLWNRTRTSLEATSVLLHIVHPCYGSNSGKIPHLRLSYHICSDHHLRNFPLILFDNR
ncbi:hypothetical protein KC19_10G072800 [Ceratodon purpureus]|uniref:Uncharacterized protein n=1 Tax=Ceratodon purpureus TaxID=3225 RepID=A0A8T0GLE2_CERPU|nr:hypothetical protein KC19_N044900 [Ceratodon purpureus]KAG0559029.1 hypothetical protein KC19_10G072800 [Ceratodon purpureus]